MQTFVQFDCSQNDGTFEEDPALPEETHGQLVSENGRNGSTEIIHDEREEIRQSKESLQSKGSSEGCLRESSESLLNEEEDDKGVTCEEDAKDGESQEDKEAIALKKRM